MEANKTGDDEDDDRRKHETPRLTKSIEFRGKRSGVRGTRERRERSGEAEYREAKGAKTTLSLGFSV